MTKTGGGEQREGIKTWFLSVKYFSCLIACHLSLCIPVGGLVTPNICRDNSPSSLLLSIPLF